MKKYTPLFFLLLFGISSSVFAQVSGQDWIKIVTTKSSGDTIRLGIKAEYSETDNWIDLNNNGICEEPQEYYQCHSAVMVYADYVIQSSTLFLYGHILELDCSNNYIIDIDPDGNDNTTGLFCQNNNLTELDVSSISALKNLNCSYNRLSELRLNGNGGNNLKYLYCSHNMLESLDLSNSRVYSEVDCSHNKISQLDLRDPSAYPFLHNLYANDNLLKQFRIRGVYIDKLDLRNNLLLQIDLDYDGDEWSGGFPDEFDARGNPAACIEINETFTPDENYYKDPTAFWSLETCEIPDTPPLGLPSIIMTVAPGSEIDFSMKAITDELPIWVTNGSTTERISVDNSWSDYTYTTNETTFTIHGYVEEFICNGNGNLITGIETVNNSTRFALKRLWCSNNSLEFVDVRSSFWLEDLNCSYNNLDELDVSGLENLEKLSCQNNSLTELIMSDCESLELLNCSNNQLTEIYTRYLPLENFKCYNNRITETLTVWSDVLSYIDCSHNTIEYASIVSNALVAINCSYNLIRALDLSDQTSLRNVICNNNQLQYLNVASSNNANFVGNTEDIAFDSRGNYNLECIVIDNGFSPPSSGSNKWLKESYHYYTSSECGPPSTVPFISLTVVEDETVNIAFNGIAMGTPVWVEKTPGVYDLRIIGSSWGGFKPPYQVNGTTLRFYGEIARFDCSENNEKITYLETLPNTTLTRLDCQDNALTGIDISGSTGLTYVRCYNNQIRNLDVGLASGLEFLYCQNNQIETLDIDNCSALYYLKCDSNNIASLDISSCTALQALFVNNNQIRELSIANNPEVCYLNCTNNALYKLNAANGNNHNFTEVIGSPSFAFSAYGNPGLSCIQIDEGFTPPVSGNKRWVKDEAAEWSETPCPVTRINIMSLTGSGYIRLKVEAEPAFQPGVWIDLNNNTRRDAGEDVTVFGEYISYPKASQTTILYGKVTELYCNSNSLSGIYPGWNPYLKKLDCSDNSIYELNLINNPDLSYLNCYKTFLSELDISQNELLDTVICNSNYIEELDISQNVNLLFLNCNKNSMSEIDARQNVLLQKLFCQENDLTRIRVPNSDHFVYLNCAGNNLDACALNEVYSEVKNRILLSDKGYIFVKTATLNNPGTDISKTSLTTNKKWQVSGTDQFGFIYTVTGDGSGCYVTGVSLNESSLSLTTGGDTAELIENVEPEYAGNKNVVWSSNNSSVAAVTSTGKIKTGEEGIATITVTTVDGGHTATCVVTVTGSSVVVPTNFQASSINISAQETDCFNATNTVTVAGDGTQVFIGNGASATFIAGQTIRFLPGFHAEPGSYVDAHITTNETFCEGFVVESIVSVPPVIEKSIEIEENKKTQENPFDEKQVKLYPNPNNGRFTLETKNFGEQKLIVVYNMAGSVVYRKKTYNNEPLQIELPIGVSGIYNLRVSDGKTVKGVKIIVR